MDCGGRQKSYLCKTFVRPEMTRDDQSPQNVHRMSELSERTAWKVDPVTMGEGGQFQFAVKDLEPEKSYALGLANPTNAAGNQ